MYGTLAILNAAKVYQTRADAEAAGIHHPYDPTKPVKNWIGSPNPMMFSEDTVQYQTVAVTKDGTVKLRGGLPYFTGTTIPLEDWPVLNQPDKALGEGNAPKQMDLSHGEVPVPMRGLAADEEFYLAFGGLPNVRKKGASPTVVTSATDLSMVSAQLENIDAKLDLLIASLSAKG